MITGLAIAAAVSGGILAGLSLDRMLVALPAWRRIGFQAWAAFSRRADLGNGKVIYPFVGLFAPACSVATAVAFYLNHNVPTGSSLPIYAAAVLSLGHVVGTSRAAPNMTKASRLGDDDHDGLQRAFQGFERWHAVRATLQALTFGANIWAVVGLR